MMKKQNKIYLGIGIVAIILIAAVVMFSGPKGEDTIKIGALYPLTGGLSEYGEAAQRSTELAVEKINQNGGINGKTLEVNYQDHECNSQTAKSIY